MDFMQEYPDEAIQDQPTITPKEEEKKVEKPKEKEEVKESLAVVETPMDPLEEAARAQGWVSLDEWEGDPSEWRPADIFVERGKYFETMSKQNKRIKQLNKQLDEMAQQIQGIRQQEYDRALADLDSQKMTAIEDGDFQKVNDLDEEIDKTKKAVADASKRVEDLSDAQKAEILRDFVGDNPWYAQNEEMRLYADRIAAGFAATDGAADVYEVLEYVVKEVKERYSDSEYFKPSTQQSADYSDDDETPVRKQNKVGTSSTIGKSTSSKRGKKVATASDLNAVQRQIGQRWVDNKVPGIESLDDYARQLQEIGEINV